MNLGVKSNRARVAVLVLAALILHVPITSLAAEGAGPLVDVRLVIEKPLRVRRLPASQGGGFGMSGAIRIEATNRSDQEILIAPLDVAGLLFEDPATGKRRAVVHPCDCAFGMRDRAERRQSIPAKGTRTAVLNEWGCDGSLWEAPPPGKWRLRYRVLPATAVPILAPDSSPEACRLALEADWPQASISDATEIVLRRGR